MHFFLIMKLKWKICNFNFFFYIIELPIITITNLNIKYIGSKVFHILLITLMLYFTHSHIISSESFIL